MNATKDTFLLSTFSSNNLRQQKGQQAVQNNDFCLFLRISALRNVAFNYFDYIKVPLGNSQYYYKRY